MSLATTISQCAAATKFNFKKHSPEILIAGGIVGGVVACVLTCKATLKADKVLDEHQKMVSTIKTTKAESKHPDIYSERDYKLDMVNAYAKTGVKFAKLYWPAATLGAVSVACILKAHNILSNRNLALLAAYKCSEETFKNYRTRIAEKYGKDIEEQIRYNVRDISKEEVDENGEVTEKTFRVADEEEVINDPSRILFDEQNPNWNDDPDRNWLFLRNVQNWCNDKLVCDGHLFLNDVRYELGLPAIPEGQLLGWILPKESSLVVGDGDGYVDFGLFNGVDDDTVKGQTKRDFLYGLNPSVMLELNYDGVIWDKI